MQTSADENVRLEISAAILTRLLAQGHLKVSELRCLDCDSMHCLVRTCLRRCAWNTPCRRKNGICPCRDEENSGGSLS